MSTLIAVLEIFGRNLFRQKKEHIYSFQVSKLYLERRLLFRAFAGEIKLIIVEKYEFEKRDKPKFWNQ